MTDMTLTMKMQRRCPYCGDCIALADCPIVATNYPGHEFRMGHTTVGDLPGIASLGDATGDDRKLYSGAKPLRLLGTTRWPVLAESPTTRAAQAADDAHGGRRSVFPGFSFGANGADLPPLHSEFDARDLPARACARCEYPLPESIDEREAVVIAVIGVNRVGKTHFLAAALNGAYQRRGLRPLRCVEFAPEEATAMRFREDYQKPLFRENRVLAPTPEDELARFEPLVFNVNIEGQDPACLIFHDIAGETLGNQRSRAAHATYLRAARGIIFIVDPRDIDDVRDRLPDWIVESSDLGYDQAALLSACLRQNGMLGSRKVPVAITIAKADLLTQAYSEDLPFLRAGNPAIETLEELFERVTTTSHQVRDFLSDCGAHHLLAIAQEYASRCASERDGGPSVGVTYHAVSAIGSQPDEDDGALTSKANPLNCTDPLAAIIGQILDLAPERARVLS